MERVKLENLNPLEYEHPFDRKALESLEATPGLSTFVKTIRKYSFDKVQKIIHTGSYLQVNENQYSKLYTIYSECCDILDFSVKPKFYLKQMYEINAYATCFADPIVVIGTGCLDVLTDDEIRFILGHELGHVKSHHLLYHDMAGIIAQIGTILGDMTLGIGGVVSLGLQIALLYWQRMSEFTSDRAGLLACQDYNAVITTIAKMAGVDRKSPEQLNPTAFMNQAREFEGFDYDTLDKLAKLYSVIELTHPWTVMRAAELDKWVSSGQYEAVLSRLTKRNIPYDTGVGRCPKCNGAVTPRDKFCPSCGNPLNN